MQELRDQNNNMIIRNYVAMPDRAQFSALEVAAATGVNEQTCRNELNRIAYAGHIVKLAKKLKGRRYYRLASEADKLQQEVLRTPVPLLALARGCSKQNMYEKLKKQGVQLPKRDRHKKHNMKPRPLSELQRSLLQELSQKEWMWSSELRGFESAIALVNKGFASREKHGKLYRYMITPKGREELNAQS